MTDDKQRLKAQAAGQSGWGTYANAGTMQRYMKLLPGRWRNRRKCSCGCGGKQSHGGYVNGLSMTGGCEWSMRHWVKHGYAVFDRQGRLRLDLVGLAADGQEKP